MANIKQWSTGEIGNTYPSRETSDNPNTKGLTTDSRPGIEAYIEEDPVDASVDNRPLKNLVSNDILIDQNASDVASEVDYGVFKDRYNEFDIEVLASDNYPDPEKPETNIYITPIRIKSGSSIINGEVTRIGNQKVIYFIKEKNNQILFPDYGSDLQMSLVINDEGYDGSYKPVYDSVAEGLPDNYENYQIQIVNDYSDGRAQRINYFSTYRDYEDIIPYKPYSEETTKEIVNFGNDINYGQDSDGYWLRSGGAKSTLDTYAELLAISSKSDGDVYYIKELNKYYKYSETTGAWSITTEDRDVNGIQGTVTSNIVLKKDISVKDKLLASSNFTSNEDGTFSHSVVTDGIFFEDITWTDTVKIDPQADILDLYVDDDDNIYFITKGTCKVANSVTGVLESKKFLFRLTSGAIELENKATGAEINDAITYTRMRRIGDYLFILGTAGFITTWDFTKNFNTDVVSDFQYFKDNPTTEAFRDVYLWQNELFIATDTKLYHTSFSEFDPLSSSFSVIDLQLKILAKTESWKGFVDNYTDLPAIIRAEGDIYYVNNDKKAYIFKNNAWTTYTINSIISNITKMNQLKGNTIASSSIDKDLENLLVNPSFEDGTAGTAPINWSLLSESGESSISVVQNSSSDSLTGNFKTFLTKNSLDITASIYQDVNLTMSSGDKYTFSVYLKPTYNKAFSSSISIEEYNDSTLLNTFTQNYSLTGSETSWTRFSVTATASTGNKLRVKVTSATEGADLQIDNAQLEIGSEANEYVENFNYLFIGFNKVYGDYSNTPYAIIDSKNKYEIQYTPKNYGEIHSINDVKFIKNNLMYAVSDTKIYTVNVLDDDGAYDRISIEEINNASGDFDLTGSISQLETIDVFNNRIFVGGTVENSVVKFSSTDFDSHTIVLSSKNTSGKESLCKLLGSTSEVTNTSSIHYSVEFDRTKSLYESNDGTTSEGKYVPGATYTITVNLDDDIDNNQIDLDITAPEKYSEPWTIDSIVSKLTTAFESLVASKPNITITSESSSTLVDGFMSFGKQDLVKHIRGDIHKIFIKDSASEYFYLVRNRQIFKTKYDPNVLKQDDKYIDYNWDLIANSTLKQYKNIKNKKVQVNDNATNTNYIDLGVDSGYKILKGSIRVKTNETTQTGFAENIDYSVDYENGRIIRNNTTNIIENNDFSFGSIGLMPNSWNDWGNKTGGIGAAGVSTRKIVDPTKFVQVCAEMHIVPVTDASHPYYDVDRIEDPTYVASHQDNLMSLYQIYKPSNMVVGDTYTFSVYLNSFHEVSDSYITLVESQSYQTAGSQTWEFTSAKTPLSVSGLKNDSTLYALKVVVNGSVHEINFQGNAAQTMQEVVSNLSSKLTDALVSWSTSNNGGITITSKTLGPQSSIVILPPDNDTYLFSVLKDAASNADTAVAGQDPKVTKSDFTLGTYNNNPEYATKVYTFSSDNIGTWKRVEVTHTVINPNSDCLRVEIRSTSQNSIFVANPQLEKNTRATLYTNSSVRSRIDPDAIVCVDFVEFRELTEGTTFENGTTEYIFDTANRKVILKEIDSNSDYYFNYKYTRIFNPYVYGDRLPIYRVVYDSRDDYFVYEFEGRIWAINQMLAMLSFDTEDPMYISYEYHFPRVDIVKIRNSPDEYGNYCYLVKGTYDETNPYRPFDKGSYDTQYTLGVDSADVENTDDNDTLYEINVTGYDYSCNEVYDRRVYINSKDHSQFNISLTPETVAYFPFTQDFNATNGMMPLSPPSTSKIVSIIKNYEITQKEEIGAWHDGYDSTLRNIIASPGASFCIFVSLDYGDDSNNGLSESTAVRTIKHALTLTYYHTANDRKNNIVITTSGGVINEDVLVNTSRKTVNGVVSSQTAYEVIIYARTYAIWRGALQNETPVTVQGIEFENSGIYPFDALNLYYCTLNDSNINCSSPQTVIIKNCECKDNHNSIVRVSDVLSPSPFIFPYQRNSIRDDGTANTKNPDIATSDNESIAPGDSWYNSGLATQPQGTYQFYRCLIYGTTDHLVQYDPNDDISNWISTFQFDQCTITRNKDLFVTNKYNLSVSFSESIIVNNGEERGDNKKYFDSNSNISMENCYIDFDKDGESIYVNYGEGIITNRTTCKGGAGADPLFLTITDTTLDFHLKSIARGSSTDSPCLDASSQAHDLGCYDELRERTEVDIPKKLRSKVAHLTEGIRYPIVLNSEKVTLSLEFKPIGTSQENLVLLDTRMSSKDEDYIVVCYNNNAYNDPDYIIDSNPSNTLDMPFKFRIVVANKEKIYSVVSPIEIYSDEEYQQWHTLTFTINYEQVYKTKTNFVDTDRQQNIITLYHNDQLAVESFIKYDLQNSTSGDTLSGDYDDGNSWNYNNISSVVTLGSDYLNARNLECYCTEVRIDNRFIDRKELELWSAKEFPFNDPYTRVNEATLAKTIEPSSLNEYWSLKTKFNKGAKWNKFLDATSNRFTYLDKQFAWVLTRPTNNYIIQSDFSGMSNAQVTAETAIDWKNLTSAVEITSDWIISSQGTRTAIDSEIVLEVSGTKLYNRDQLVEMLDSAFAPHTQSNVKYTMTSDNRIRFYTEDYGVTKLLVNLGQDYEKVGFDLPVAPASVREGVPSHGGSEYSVSTGIPVTISPTDDQFIVAQKTITALNAVNGKFTAAIVQLNGVDTSTISLTSTVKGTCENIRSGNLLRADVSTVIDGTTELAEQSQIYFKSGIELDSTGTSKNNADYYGKYFEFFDIDRKKYYVWYKSPFAGDTVDPNPDASGWFVEGISPGTIGSNGNNVWIETSSDYVNLSTQSLAVERLNNLEDPLYVYQKLELTLATDSDGNTISPTNYYFSMNCYYDGYLKSDNIKFLFGTSTSDRKDYDFDSIERNVGNWWICKKKVQITQPTKYIVGLDVLSSDTIYIDTVQFEQNNFATPWISNATSDENQIVISKSLLGETKGTIFFRWKPLFDYSSTDDRIIFQVNGRKYDSSGNATSLADVNKGFTIRYHYDSRKEYGSLIYSINDFDRTNSSNWSIKVPEITWDRWHSSAIVYDFDADKFYFAFDYYRQVLDMPLNKFEDEDALWTPVYIGRDATSGVDPDISQQTEVIIPGDTDSSLSGKYWLIESKDYKYYVWYNVDGSSTNPGIPSHTSVEIDISANDTSTTVAQRTLMELGSYPTNSLTKDFLVTRTNNILIIKNKVAGSVTEPAPGTAGVIINVTTPGSNSLGEKAYGYECAEIAVKDIILTSNAISETEELKWHNSYEFFNEYLLINTLNSYNDSIESLIFDVSEIASSPLEVSRRIDSVESDIDGLQISQGNLESDVNLLTNLVQSSQAVALEQIKTDLATVTTTVYSHGTNIELMQDGGTGQWTASMATASGGRYNIYDIRSDVNSFRSNLDSEVTSRSQGDQIIRDDFASTVLGKGASLIGIDDSHSVFTTISSQTVEAALQSLAGYDTANPNAHRTTESIYSNSLAINTINNSLNSSIIDFAYAMDGTATGSGWSRALASDSNYNIRDLRLDTDDLYNRVALIKDGRKTSSQGYQVARFNSVITNSSLTGLQSQDYSLDIKVNGNLSSYIIAGSSAVTWADLIQLLNQQLVGATISITGSDSSCKITSNTYGSSSSIEITGGTLFVIGSLKAPGPVFTTLETNVAGKDDAWNSDTMNLYTLRSDLDSEVLARQTYQQNILSNATSKGASLVGIADTANIIAATNVEAALYELAGAGRTTQSLKSLSDRIDTSDTNIASNLVEINKIKDGTSGTAWSSSMNLKSHQDHLDIVDSTLTARLADITAIKGTSWASSMNLTSHDSRITSAEGQITTHSQNITNLQLVDTNEQSARIVGDQAIRDDLASGSDGKGASLIGVRDTADNFTKTNVEGVLAEISDKIKALGGAISWQAPVATYNDLPIEGNKLSDSRTVKDDGDGKPAQYLCIAITGTRSEQWVKIADIDWHNASDIAFDNTLTQPSSSTTVQKIVEDVWKRTNDIQIDTKTIDIADWISDSGMYYYNYAHNLGTVDVVLNIVDSTTLTTIGVDEIIRIDANTVQIRSSNPVDVIIYCFAAVNNYSTMINTYDNSDTRYSATIKHNLGTKHVLLSVFDTVTGSKIQPGDVQIIDDNSIKIFVEDNTLTLNVYILKKIESSISKDISAWTLDGSFYTAQLEVGAAGYDNVYQFFDPTSMKSVEVESVAIINGRLHITKSDNSLIRLVVLK